MTLGFGKVIPSSLARRAEPVELPVPAPPERWGTFVPPDVVAAAERARRIVEQAQAEAAEIRARATSELDTLRAEVIADARANAAARLAAEALALQAREASADARALERNVELARLLAERLLGEALALDPARIEAIARRALTEASGARRIVIVAHPDDVPFLRASLEAGRLNHVAQITENSARSRGSLRFETELGTLDAEIAPQLDRLADRLRQALQP